VCDSCGSTAVKYRCPACERRTCSAPCVAEHKVRHSCTGKRPRAEFVAPLRNFTDRVVAKDFCFLEEVDAAVDRADRSLRLRCTELRLYQQKRHLQRVALARACAERGTRLILAPAAMDLARNNSTQLKGGGGGGGNANNNNSWGRKFRRPFGGRGYGVSAVPQWISWKVEWHFGRSGQVLTDKGLAEHEVLGPSLDRFFQNKCPWGATRHLLLPYADAGLEQLEVYLHQPPRVAAAADGKGDGRGRRGGESSEEDEEEGSGEEDKGSDDSSSTPAVANHVLFQRLDKSLSLRENFRGRAIVEFPVLHVALPQELASFASGAEGPAA